MGRKVRQIALGSHHSLLVMAEGDVYGWVSGGVFLFSSMQLYLHICLRV